ncbi:hypothetical protein AAC387_Pa08g0074 [Persea americana]
MRGKGQRFGPLCAAASKTHESGVRILSRRPRQLYLYSMTRLCIRGNTQIRDPKEASEPLSLTCCVISPQSLLRFLSPLPWKSKTLA